MIERPKRVPWLGLLAQPNSDTFPGFIGKLRSVSQLLIVGVSTRTLQKLQLTYVTGAHITLEQTTGLNPGHSGQAGSLPCLDDVQRESLVDDFC